MAGLKIIKAQPKVAATSWKDSVLFSISAFLETPVTKKQLIITGLVCAGAWYIYQNSSYPKISWVSFSGNPESEGNSELKDNKQRKIGSVAPNNSANDDDMSEEGNNAPVFRFTNTEGTKVDNPAAGYDIIDEENNKATQDDKPSNQGFFGNIFRK